MTQTDQLNQLNSIANFNGGGLSTAITGKYTSVRHAMAKASGKLTAGDAVKLLRKELKDRTIIKNDVLGAYNLLFGREPEWHHAGFYRNNSGRSTMGRTFFFNEEEILKLLENWGNLEFLKNEKEKERLAVLSIEEQKRVCTQEFLKNKNAVIFTRKLTAPENSYVTIEEMNGKYGWFEASHYNLPIYYSGYQFTTPEDLQEFINLKRELNK
jgi:hypothetical protein